MRLQGEAADIPHGALIAVTAAASLLTTRRDTDLSVDRVMSIIASRGAGRRAYTAVVVGWNGGACTALAEAGVQVTVVDTSRPAEALPDGVEFFPGPAAGVDASEAFADHLELLARVVSPHTRPVLFAASDAGLLAIAAWRERLDRVFAVACAAPEIVRRLVSKAAFADWASAVGLPIPPSIVVRDTEQLAQLLPGVPLPCLVKPEHTFVLEEAAGQKLFCARSPDEVEAAVRTCLANGQAALLQVDISDAGRSPQWSLAALCAEDGTIRKAVLARKLRQIRWGAGTAMETVPMDDRLFTLAQQLTSRLGVSGLVEIELRADAAAVPHIIEVNPRIWRQALLPAAAGVNLMFDAHQMALGRPIAASSPYRTGIGWLRWRGDLTACLGMLRRREISPLAIVRSLPRVRVVE